MIFAEQKPFDEIYTSIKPYSTIMILGCGTCTTVCMSGGEEEVQVLSSKLALEDPSKEVRTNTLRRQCDPEFLEEINEQVKGCDAVLSLACGAGVQMIADKLEDIPVIPGLNSRFVGTNEGEQSWKQRCSLCGDCVLDQTGGVCPFTLCPKGLMNGPCGGSSEGKCEVNPENECAWVTIYNRLKKQGRLKNIYTIFAPREFGRTISPQAETEHKKDLEQTDE